jgi:hypothetical protein
MSLLQEFKEFADRMGEKADIPEGVVISAVTSADPVVLREIAALGILAWGREPTASEVENRAEKLEEEIVSLDQSEKALFVAKRSGMIVGFGRVVRDSKKDPSEWWLLGLVVHPDYRRPRGFLAGILSTMIRTRLLKEMMLRLRMGQQLPVLLYGGNFLACMLMCYLK